MTLIAVNRWKMEAETEKGGFRVILGHTCGHNTSTIFGCVYFICFQYAIVPNKYATNKAN